MSKWEIISGLEVKRSNPKNYTSKRRTENFMNTVKKLDAKDLKDYGNTLYEKKIAREENLLQASADNKLKSEALIAEASRIKKERSKKNKNKETQDKE